jgi:CheY-like chemotaxis protein
MNEPKANSAGRENHARGLIYVVDDEAMLLELAVVILEPLHYYVRTFRDPQLALQAFAEADTRPDLVITDYAMHQLDGLALIEGFRRLEPSQKIILVSGTVGPEVLVNAPAQPDRFLSKPYQAKQLVDLVRSLLPNHSSLANS